MCLGIKIAAYVDQQWTSIYHANCDQLVEYNLISKNVPPVQNIENHFM